MVILEPLAGALAKEAAKEAIANRHILGAAVKAAISRIRDGRVVVALFGVGGAGKSTTQKLLAEGIDAGVMPDPYLPTTHAKSEKHGEHYFTSVWDTAGQEDFRAQSWATTVEALRSTRRAVVINVVSFGLNSPASATLSQIKARHKKKTKDDAIAAYLLSERTRELTLLTELRGELRNHTGPLQMVTFINKQDLWWHERQKVVKHYQVGAYSKRIEELRHDHGAKNFTHQFASASLCQLNLCAGNGEVLRQTSAGYDLSIREPHFNNLLKSISSAIDGTTR